MIVSLECSQANVFTLVPGRHGFQAEDKALARAKENWEWTRFESTFAVPKDFVLLELEFTYRNGCFTLQRAVEAGVAPPIAALQFGGVVHYTTVRCLAVILPHRALLLAGIAVFSPCSSAGPSMVDGLC